MQSEPLLAPCPGLPPPSSQLWTESRTCDGPCSARGPTAVTPDRPRPALPTDSLCTWRDTEQRGGARTRPMGRGQAQPQGSTHPRPGGPQPVAEDKASKTGRREARWRIGAALEARVAACTAHSATSLPPGGWTPQSELLSPATGEAARRARGLSTQGAQAVLRGPGAALYREAAGGAQCAPRGPEPAQWAEPRPSRLLEHPSLPPVVAAASSSRAHTPEGGWGGQAAHRLLRPPRHG